MSKKAIVRKKPILLAPVHAHGRAYLKQNHPSTFRSGEVAEIIGVRSVSPSEDSPERVCWHILYEDGVADFVPVFDVSANYTVITESGRALRGLGLGEHVG